MTKHHLGNKVRSLSTPPPNHLVLSMRTHSLLSAIAYISISVCNYGFAVEPPPMPTSAEQRISAVSYETEEEYGNPKVWERAEAPTQLVIEFEDGVAFKTADDEFEFRIRLMQQTDFKLFLPRDQEPARPGVYIPRFRSYFEGHITRSYDYELSIQRSVEGEFDVLDANINFHPMDEFQIKVGRFIVPYSYDWYDHLEQFFITPERSLFPLNFGLSREAGLMFWGDLNEGRTQYALGGFSGQLEGLADTNTTRDLVGYLNFRPFRDSQWWELENLNIGGSAGIGDQAFPSEPLPLRSSLQSSENDDAAQAASSIFLEWEEDVVASGGRDQAALHLAWYVEQLSFESEVQYGRFEYHTPHEKVDLPVFGYHFGLSYFLTGEEVTGRSLVIPNRPFNPASGSSGPGAIEPFVRYSYLDLGEEVFDAELADRADWTRRISMIDLGWNWYPNRYMKFYFDWQVKFYDSPVLINPTEDERVNQSHLLWVRAQVFF